MKTRVILCYTIMFSIAQDVELKDSQVSNKSRVLLLTKAALYLLVGLEIYTFIILLTKLYQGLQDAKLKNSVM